MALQIKVRGLDKALRAFQQGNSFAKKELREAMDKAVFFAHAYIAVYPPPPPAGYWAQHTTQAQKAAFFAQLRKGGWDRRTGKLGQSWTTDVRETRASLHGVVGNIRGYAPYVQDRDRQAAFHKGRWRVVQDITKPKLAKPIIGFFEVAIARILNFLAP